MRIMITGASGNVGTALLRRLDAEGGRELSAVARRPPPTDEAPYSAARWHQVDLSGPSAAAQLTALAHEVDAVVHLAWAIQPGRDRELLRRTNQNGSRAVLEAVQAARVPHLVHMSSVGAYSPAWPPHRWVDESYPTEGVPSSSYSVDKAFTERLLENLTAADAPIVTRVRPALVLQPDAAAEIGRYFLGRLVPTAALRPGILRFTPWPGSFVVQFVHADDVADALVRILQTRLPGAVNLAADPVIDRSTIRQVFAGVGPSLPGPVVRAAASVTWRLRLQPTDAGWIDLARSVPLLRTDRARDELDWRPFHRADEVLSAFVEALRHRHGAAGPLLYPGH
jgi:UDP-glucose 4-epimerase